MALKKFKISEGAKNAFGTIVKAADQNSPTILTGLAVAGFVGTIVLVVKAVPKAEKILDNRAKKMKEVEGKELDDEKLKEAKTEITVETVKEMIPVVLPPIVTGGLSIACCIGSNSVNLRRQAVLSAAYNVAQSTLAEYKDKLPSIVGASKAEKVIDAIAEDHVTKNPPADNQIIVTGYGEVLCFDDYSGRYFKSNPEKIREAVNDLNETLMDCMYVSLNEFYREIGLAEIKLGDDLGWNIDKGKISVKYTSILTENNVPCLVLEYDIDVRTDYRNLH